MEHKVKICSECGAVKPLDEFVKNKECKDGREPKCKSCRKEYFKKYYVKNRDEILENQKKYYVKNRDKIDERNRKYRAKNRDKILEYKKKYRA